MSEWLTRKEAAELLGVSPRTIIRIAQRHHIPTYKKEGSVKVLYRMADITRLIRPRRTNGS